MASFADLAIAMEYKKVMTGIVQEVLDSSRPSYRYGQITDIDPVNQKASVLYPGEDFPNVVNYGTVQPYVIGQYVRTEGATGDRYISDTQDGHSVHTGSVLFSDYFRNVDDVRSILAKMTSGDAYGDGISRLSFTGSNSSTLIAQIKENDGTFYILNAVLGDPGTGYGYISKPSNGDPYIAKRIANSNALQKARAQISSGNWATVNNNFSVQMSPATAGDVSVTCNADAGAQVTASNATYVSLTGFIQRIASYTGTSLWVDYHAWAE